MKRTAPLLIGIVVALTRYWANAPSDMLWPHCAARLLLAGSDPYGASCLLTRPNGAMWVVNPLPTVLTLLPFAWLPIELVTAIILGLSSAFMAWGLLRRAPHMLLLFLSVPFLHAWYYGQWSPLILGVALSPAFLPLVLIKPHIGLPALLTNLTRKRLLAVALFGLATLFISPAWPWRWLSLLDTYDGYIPLLTVFGAPVLLLLARWRDPDARYVLLCALVPQRGVYDVLITAAALRSRRAVLIWVVCGWLITYLGWRYLPISADGVVVLATYLPMTAILIAPTTAASIDWFRSMRSADRGRPDRRS